MKVLSETSRDRQITVSATIDELATLYDATRKGRRSKAQEKILLEFGDALLNSDPALQRLVALDEEEARAGDAAGAV